MKKIFIIILAILAIYSCSKDETTINLATPSLEWNTTSVTDNVLEVSITINSEDELPDGELEFQIDGITVNSFSITKGTKIHTTDYVFTDFDKHEASVIYNFFDGRNAISKSIDIKKSLQEVLQKSSKTDWMDF